MIRVLFLGANPTDTHRLRLDEEVREIDQALRMAEFRDLFDIQQHWAVRTTDLQGLLLRHQPDIVHFGGHGSPASEIILEDPDGTSRPVPAEALSDLFALLRGNIRCVVLNACYTEKQARAIGKHIECVIGTSKAIGDVAAIRFAAAFYQAVGYGKDVETAFQLGCNQIHLGGLGEQDTPQLIADRVKPSDVVLTPPAGSGAGFAVKPLTGREVPRAGRMDELRQLLLDAKSTVGVTTALRGTGGFGKTTIARMLAHDPQVQAAFPDGIIWVDMGEKLTGAELASRIGDVVWKLSGTKPPLSDPLLAGTELGKALRDHRVLLVIDDVWAAGQLEPFLIDGPTTVRLITTRQSSVLPDGTRVVTVDRMTEPEATALLLSDLDTTTHPVPQRLVTALLATTGRWALLLGLVNAAVRARKGPATDHRWVDRELTEIHQALVTGGPTVLDINDPTDRTRAVAATLGVSLALLTEDERARYRELTVFGEDVDIPRTVLERYWEHTAGWSRYQTGRLCRRLDDLALVASYTHEEEPQIRLHDVIRAFLRDPTTLPRLHRDLIDAHRSLVPTLEAQTAWWELPNEATYLRNRLCRHLSEAGLNPELIRLLLNPRYLLARLEHGGPAALEADLALGREDPAVAALEVVVRQNGHLLAPLEPPGSLAATFASRLDHLDLLRDVARGLYDLAGHPALRPMWPMPDLAHPALKRVLIGHTNPVTAVAIAPDGTWLATTSSDAARIWDTTTGEIRHTLTGHTDPGRAATIRTAPRGTWMAIAPDGTWLSTVSSDHTARIWDATTGELRHTLTGHTDEITAMAIAPDGTWLSTISSDHTARIWDATTGELRHTLTGHTDEITAMAIAPDGTWLATTSYDQTVRIWDTATGELRHTLTGHTTSVVAVAIAPDGIWLATTSYDQTVRIWDTPTGELRHTLTGHTSSEIAVAIAPDGTWLGAWVGNTPVGVLGRISRLRENWVWLVGMMVGCSRLSRSG